MSDTVPVLKVGDRVRVMDTTTAREIGIANMRGVVVGVHGPGRWGDTVYRLKVDGGGLALVESSTLAKESTHAR